MRSVHNLLVAVGRVLTAHIRFKQRFVETRTLAGGISANLEMNVLRLHGCCRSFDCISMKRLLFTFLGLISLQTYGQD